MKFPLVIHALSAVVAFAAAPSPEEALKKMRVADGFAVKLMAHEPQIRQPLSVSFDSRGRMWVLQYLQYPNPNGLKAVSVDQYLRTKYDRVPEPPPQGPKGADKITICEDTNADGIPDKFTDFVSGLNLASGFALGHGGVFVVQPPYLLFYPDKNRDDVPDSNPQVLLTGFGLEDSHALANSLTWGPDGWLYGAHGSTVTANIRGVEFQQGIWRYHPITREFELFAEGGGNTWGLDFDEDGEIIAGTNFGEQIGLHQVQGGYYVKGFAKHGPLHNPHTYGYFEHIPMRGFKGGHVTCGGVVYQNEWFPEKFRGAYIAANLLSSAIYWHGFERNGSSFKAHFGGTLLESSDPTFRPVDCTFGPDGALYVSDWCDPRASHVDPVDNWEKDTGRIYRIAPALNEAAIGSPGPKIDLRKASTAQVANYLTDPNDWWRREARSILAERRDAKIVPRLRAQTLQQTNNLLALQSLWATYVSGGFNDAFAEKTLRHTHAPVRAWTVRLLGDAKKLSPEMQWQLTQLAREEKSPVVRRQLACSAKRFSANNAIPIVRELLTHDEDANDPHIPLLLWWAIEDKAKANSREVLALLSNAKDWEHPLTRTHILERIARRYADAGGDYTACSWLLMSAPSSELRDTVLRGFDLAWQGRRIVPVQSLTQAFAQAWQAGPNHSALMLRVGIRMNFLPAVEVALKDLADAKTPEAERAELASIAGECAIAAARPALLTLLTNKPRLQLAAVAALQNFDDANIATALITHYTRFNPEARTRARTALASRATWSRELVQAVDAGQFDAKELSPDVLRQMIRHNDAPLTAAIEKRWGKLQAQSSADKISAINRLKLILNPSGTTLRFKGDAAEGKKLFTQACASCHKLFGEGNTIGPELTGADRKNSEWLLTQIVDPSAFIRPEYVNHNVEMKDGRSLSGLLVEQTDSAVTLLDAQNQRTVLNRADVKEINASSTSLMSEALLDPLTPQQVRDLFAYLQEGENSKLQNPNSK